MWVFPKVNGLWPPVPIPGCKDQSQAEILCDILSSLTGSGPNNTRYDWEPYHEPGSATPVLVRTTYSADGTILKVEGFNVDGTPYTGDVTKLELGGGSTSVTISTLPLAPNAATESTLENILTFDALIAAHTANLDVPLSSIGGGAVPVASSSESVASVTGVSSVVLIANSGRVGGWARNSPENDDYIWVSYSGTASIVKPTRLAPGEDLPFLKFGTIYRGAIAAITSGATLNLEIVEL